MCASCGCNEPNEQHGDNANITQTQIEKAAQAADISPQQAAENMLQSLR